MLPDMIKSAFADGTGVPIKKVTNVRTIANAMQKSEIFKGMLSEIDKVLNIYFICNICHSREIISLLHIELGPTYKFYGSLQT